MSKTELTRAERLRLELYRRHGHGGITRVARAIGKSRNFVSGLLNGNEVGEPTLDLIEAWLKSQEESEEPFHAIA